MGRVAPPRRWTGHLSPESNPARPTWTAGESPRGFQSPAPMRGDLSGRRGRKVACTAFSLVLPYQTPALGKGGSFHSAKRCDAGGERRVGPPVMAG